MPRSSRYDCTIAAVRRGKRDAYMSHHTKQRKADNDVQRDRHEGYAERRARVFTRKVGRRRHLHEAQSEQPYCKRLQ